MYQEKFYRSWSKGSGFTSFRVCINETDLLIQANSNLSEQAESSAKKYRQQIEDYIKNNPEFLSSLSPLPQSTGDYPVIIRIMLEESIRANVGPMAAVAGAIAEFTGRDLLKYSDEVIVENGGDIFLKTKKKIVIGLYSGKDSQFSKNIGLEIQPEQTPLGICTSSGSIGHSLSFGKSDAVVVLSKSTAFADALATKIGNQIKSPQDINAGIKTAQQYPQITGIVIACRDKIGFLGDIRIVRAS
jgi:ApbE superfamily uncharacterized protein (UPF0280 family)